MPVTSSVARSGFVLAGLCLAAYPALRPDAPDTGVAGARGFARAAWLGSHASAMVGFVLLALALRALATRDLRWRAVETTAWAGVVLVLPYYGAEAYGLHAVGQYAVASADPAAVAGATAFRTDPLAATTFLVGLVLLGAVGILLTQRSWSDGRGTRTAGLVVALALATYVPQFFAPAEVRVLHGLLLGLGLACLGLLGVGTAPPDGPGRARPEDPGQA